MLLYTFPKFSPHHLFDTTSCLENETINTRLVTQHIVDHDEYQIRKPPEPHLVKEHKGVHLDLIDKRL